MKEAYPGKMIEGEVKRSATESSEHGLDKEVERESGEIFPHERKIGSSIRTVSPVRPAPAHAPEFSLEKQMKGKPDESTAGDAGRSGSVAEGSSRGVVTQADLVKIWALDKAPPPIKIHPDGEDSENSSHELSPPPSPKRKKDLLEKDNTISRPFSPVAVLPQDSI